MTGFRLLSLLIMTESTLQLKPPRSCSTLIRTHDSDLNPFVSPNLNPWIISRPGWPEQPMRHRPHWSRQLTTWPSFTIFTGAKPQDTVLATKCGLALRTSEQLARQKNSTTNGSAPIPLTGLSPVMRTGSNYRVFWPSPPHLLCHTTMPL